MSEQTPGTVAKFAERAAKTVAFMHSGPTHEELARFASDHDAEDAAMRTALERIVKRGSDWLANNHDYRTAYADRPEADRAANAMLIIARAALEGRAPAPTARDEAFAQMLAALRAVWSEYAPDDADSAENAEYMECIQNNEEGWIAAQMPYPVLNQLLSAIVAAEAANCVRVTT